MSHLWLFGDVYGGAGEHAGTVGQLPSARLMTAPKSNPAVRRNSSIEIRRGDRQLGGLRCRLTATAPCTHAVAGRVLPSISTATIADGVFPLRFAVGFPQRASRELMGSMDLERDLR